MDRNSPIKEIMTTDLITARVEDSVNRIRQIFEANNFHHLPVIDNGNVLVGIISREDINKVVQLLAFDAKNAKHGPMRAKDIMSQSPMLLDPEDTIGLAADVFMTNKFHALPIVEDDKLIGIVTTHDLLSYCFSSPL
ncbi:MAG: CBS domain-containing protein [Bacteroidetes bacterium]|nr:MAG: CBS domain-containing protein [Bacteroidota bacterium]